MEIRFLHNHDIDRQAWDEAINGSRGANIYSLSWYLDAVCPGWTAMATEDYSMVMPLPSRRKYGFNYIFRPVLTQQLGIFSRQPADTDSISMFIDKIPGRYRFIQYCLNQNNEVAKEYKPIMHSTYELDLSQDYEKIRSGFSANHNRNARKAESSGYRIADNISIEEFIKLLRRDNSAGSKILSSGDNLLLLIRLAEEMVSRDAASLHGIYDGKGELIAAVLFGKSHNRWYYLVPVNSEKGKEGRAMFLLIGDLIRKRSGKKEILDFEGSDIPGLAKFYQGFGAVQKQYPEIRINKLPWPIKLLK
jgi:hypothetical protein